MTRFSNSVLLKSQRSYLNNPGYLVGHILAEDKEVIVYTWEIMDLLLVLNKRDGPTLVNV